MGQSAKPRGKQLKALPSLVETSIFRTEIGWMGTAGVDGKLICLTVGHATAAEVRRDLKARLAECCGDRTPKEADWNPKLREKLELYGSGAPIEFDEVQLELPPRTVFQRRVIEITRAIPYGRTMSYGEVAAEAGHPRAARAVGTVMSSNRIPVIIPCHRVTASQGATGGYSGPQGVTLKKQLLDLEAEGCAFGRARAER